MSPNTTVGFRSFGAVPANIIPWSDAFIQETQRNNIIATAKHFPGHGLVTGDTHKALQVIDGEMKEICNYPTLIANGVLSIMVAANCRGQSPRCIDFNQLGDTLPSVFISGVCIMVLMF